MTGQLGEETARIEAQIQPYLDEMAKKLFDEGARKCCGCLKDVRRIKSEMA